MKSIQKKIYKLNEYLKRKEFLKLKDNFDQIEKIKKNEKEEESFENLKNGIYECLIFELKKSISSGKTVEKIKIELLLRMNPYQIAEAKQFIRNATLRRYILEFQSQNMSLKNLNTLKNTFENLNDLFDRVKFFYGKLPKEWNLEGEFIFYSVLHIKEILFEAYISNWTKIEYIHCLNSIIDFERKFTKFHFKKDCCVNDSKLITHDQNMNMTNHSYSENPKCTEIVKYNPKCNHISEQVILFDKDQILTKKKNLKTNFIVLYHKNSRNLSEFCRHRKMLSRLFLPDIKIYINYLFESVKKISFNQKVIEMNLISSFVSFFGEIGKILVQIQHFEEPDVYTEFLKLTDNSLSYLVDKIKIPSNYKDLLICLNTSYFVENTLNDLIEKTSRFSSYNDEVRNKIRIKERVICSKIEKILKVIFKRNIKKKTKFATQFIEILNKEIFILNKIEYSESVFDFLLETLFSLLFSSIVTIKMSHILAEQLIDEIGEIKWFISQKWSKVQMLELIENYLKIFICRTDKPKEFVTYFNQLNQNIFNFKNILEALDDKSNNNLLMYEYKNQSKLMKCKDMNKT